jgi:hypothetical protein
MEPDLEPVRVDGDRLGRAARDRQIGWRQVADVFAAEPDVAIELGLELVRVACVRRCRGD